MVYELTFHFAVMVMFSAGMVAGIALSQPMNVYPSLVGSAGVVIAVP